jgi:aerobic-type carbon monoxide dehydrogenase small subunit (CoxS/CutS family)
MSTPILGPRPVPLTLEVNGEPRRLEVEPRMTLLEVLRERLDLTGAKPACERGECGACAVLVEGQPVNACHVLAVQVAGKRIETVEGLARRPDFRPLLDAFVRADAGQCGYCTPGFAVATYAMLRDEPTVDETRIRWNLVGHICRCNAYDAIVTAVREAAAARLSPAQAGPAAQPAPSRGARP